MSSSNNRHRSSSLGAVPHKKQLARSRAQSSAASPLEVRCACQFFQCESLIPERVNPIGTNVGSSTSTRPQSRAGGNSSQHIIEEEEAMMNNNGSILSFGRTSVPDYYGETSTSPIRSPERLPAQQHPQYHQPQQNLQYSRQQTPQLTSDFNHPLSSPQRDWRYSNKENSLPPAARNQPLSFEGRNIPSIEVETFSLDPTFTHAEASDRLKIDNVYSSREFGDELAQIENENGVVTGYSAFDKTGIVENENNGFRGRSMDRRSIAIGPVGVGGISRDAREMSQPVTVTTMITNQFSSQKSLDRYSNSVLLNRYRQKSQSRSNSVAPSMTDVRFPPRMVKTVSFDYGKPTTNSGSANNNGGNANPNFDQYHRMSPMVFHVRERLQKIEQIHSHNQNQQRVEVG